MPDVLVSAAFMAINGRSKMMAQMEGCQPHAVAWKPLFECGAFNTLPPLQRGHPGFDPAERYFTNRPRFAKRRGHRDDQPSAMKCRRRA